MALDLPSDKSTTDDLGTRYLGLSRAGLKDRAEIPSYTGDASLGTAASAGDVAGPEQAVSGPSDLEKLHNQGLSEFYGMRLTWSKWLIGWVTCLIAFQIVLTGAIGTGALNFTGHETFLNLTVGQNFVQVVALAMIVVRFLHSRNKDDNPL